MVENVFNYVLVSLELDKSGLIWSPEIGDEVTQREDLKRVSIFVDPQGLTPSTLRESFIWLPTVEQLVQQFEARQALIFHAGVNENLHYQAVIKTTAGVIETNAETLRLAFGKALQEVLEDDVTEVLH